ncbi:MAG: HIT family protein [Candidatus Colwellbacteria bacterium]|nr:HIT family protein [Candidatus Colwellbacteria bacterium]
MDCLFCKIGSGEISSEVIYEDDHVLAFLDVHPISLGHTLIIPKIHAENILDLPEESVGPVFSAVRKVTGILKESINPQGFTIGINHGRMSGQAIDHLHIHIIPRFEGDKGGSLHSVVKNPPKEPVSVTRERIVGR